MLLLGDEIEVEGSIRICGVLQGFFQGGTRIASERLLGSMARRVVVVEKRSAEKLNRDGGGSTMQQGGFGRVYRNTPSEYIKKNKDKP